MERSLRRKPRKSACVDEPSRGKAKACIQRVRRGRGRPRKRHTVNSGDAEASPVPEPAAVPDTVNIVEQPLRRGRGRPRKAGSVAEESFGREAMSVAEQSVHRGRGRPRKAGSEFEAPTSQDSAGFSITVKQAVVKRAQRSLHRLGQHKRANGKLRWHSKQKHGRRGSLSLKRLRQNCLHKIRT